MLSSLFPFLFTSSNTVPSIVLASFLTFILNVGASSQSSSLLSIPFPGTESSSINPPSFVEYSSICTVFLKPSFNITFPSLFFLTLNVKSIWFL